MEFHTAGVWSAEEIMRYIGKHFRLRLLIDGKYVPLKPFLNNFVKQIILSMVFNLDGVKKPRKIEVVVEDVKVKCDVHGNLK